MDFDDIRDEGPEAQSADGRRLRGDATRERVLDAAERLFAKLGFDGVSIREIAKEAGVTLGVVGFHGKSKHQLFQTVLERRVATLSAVRRSALATLQEDPLVTPGVTALMRAYITPHLEIASSGDRQWRAYARLIARTNHDENWYGVLHELYDPVTVLYIAALQRALPGAKRERLASAFFMSVYAMHSTSVATARVQALTNTAPADVRSALRDHAETLIAFCATGLEASAMMSDTSGSPDG